MLFGVFEALKCNYIVKTVSFIYYYIHKYIIDW